MPPTLSTPVPRQRRYPLPDPLDLHAGDSLGSATALTQAINRVATEMAVVDPRSMRVHGTGGLRVVDASVMPTLTNGNIYAPVMMIAEKAADLILGNTPLEASAAPQYRHDASEVER